MRLVKYILAGLILGAGISNPGTLKAQSGTLEMKDTYFHRFYYETIIMGTNTPGKYGMNYSMGDNIGAWGLLLDFDNNFANRFVKSDNISQTFGFLLYGFENDITGGPIHPTFGTAPVGTSMTAISLAYGWNMYDLPLGIDLYTGFNLYWGKKSVIYAPPPHSGTMFQKDEKSFFIPAPYIYMSKPWYLNFRGEPTVMRTFFDLMVAEDYRDLAKLAGRAVLGLSRFDIMFSTERNATEYTDSYENSISIQKNFGTEWFFRNVIGLVSKEMRESTDENWAAVSETDQMIMGDLGFYRLKGGSTFTVNNLINEQFTDKMGSADNFFVKAEFGFVLALGLSYKVDSGMGWKFGLDYSLDSAIFATEDAERSMNASSNKMFSFDMLQGKDVFVSLGYARNYVNDDIFGMRVEPKLFYISLILR